jgi:hypothetical protein
MSTVVDISLRSERDFFIVPVTAVVSENKEPLSMDNMGPVSIDLDLLTAQDRNAILYNISCGRLLSNNKIDIAPPSPVTTEPTPAPVAPPAKKVDPLQRSVSRQKQVIPILNGKVGEVKVRIATLDSSKDLAILKDAEKRGKKRKTVFAAIDTRMKELAEVVANAIATGPSMRPPRVQVGMERINDIVEDEFEEITVTFGTQEE